MASTSQAIRLTQHGFQKIRETNGTLPRVSVIGLILSRSSAKSEILAMFVSTWRKLILQSIAFQRLSTALQTFSSQEGGNEVPQSSVPKVQSWWLIFCQAPSQQRKGVHWSFYKRNASVQALTQLGFRDTTSLAAHSTRNTGPRCLI